MQILKQRTNSPGYKKVSIQIYHMEAYEYLPLMLISAGIYLVLYLYLSQVVPNEYGT